jgi:hypothetical protein
MELQKRTLSSIRMFPDEEMVSSFSAFRFSPVHQRETFAWLICDPDVTRDRGLCL